jgi:hypothetical protein
MRKVSSTGRGTSSVGTVAELERLNRGRKTQKKSPPRHAREEAKPVRSTGLRPVFASQRVLRTTLVALEGASHGR